MLSAERLQKICDIVNERKSIRVLELSEICKVTEETIRRDLSKLESDQKIRRTHGGAMIYADSPKETPYYEREIAYKDEKRKIAEEAVKHILPRERILLDASSTAWYMAKLIPNIPLTVLTNSIKVALELSTKEKIQVISTGGILNPDSLSYVGPLAERAIEQYHVDRLFFSCKGVHSDLGISESSEMQALIKKRMIQAAENIYLLADHSKFGVKSFTHLSDWDQINYVITDRETHPSEIQKLKENGIQVIQLNR